MTREIPLSQGAVAIVDDEDAAAVMAVGKWSVCIKPNVRYAVRAVRRDDGRATSTRLHNFITGFPFVDHINSDGLDNRRSNLRAASHATNARNVGLIASNTSGFKGVTWHRAAGRWVAQIQVDRQRIYLGLHDTPEQAARAYDAAALTHFGEFARLNFPQELAS